MNRYESLVAAGLPPTPEVPIVVVEDIEINIIEPPAIQAGLETLSVTPLEKEPSKVFDKDRSRKAAKALAELALAAVTLLATGATPASAATPPVATAHATPIHRPIRHKPIHRPEAPPLALPNPNSLTISEAAKQQIENNSVLISALGCSGDLIRDKITGQAIGVMTARHCIIDKGPIIDGSDGTHNIIFNDPILVGTGASTDSLTLAGTVNKFIFDKLGMTQIVNSDMAIGIFDTSTPEAVLSAINMLGINQIHVGDTIDMSGWPGYQPKNTSGYANRENLSAVVIGKVQAKSSKGAYTESLLVAVKANQDGAVCSPGISGAVGFVIKNGITFAIGTVASTEDLGLKNPGLNAYAYSSSTLEKKYNVRGLAAYDAVCDLSVQFPTPAIGAIEVNIVSNASQIPGYKP
jgi:hypothetical protein